MDYSKKYYNQLLVDKISIVKKKIVINQNKNIGTMGKSLDQIKLGETINISPPATKS